jgi:putative ABC transport system permease protein
MEIKKIAYLNLVRRPASTWITLFSVGFAVGLGGLLLVLSHHVSRSLSAIDPSIDLIIGPKSSGLEILSQGLYSRQTQPDLISDGFLPSIQEELGAPIHFVPLYHFSSVKNKFPVIATDARWLERPADLPRPSLRLGRWFEARGEAVIGAAVAKALRLKPGDTLVATSLPFKNDPAFHVSSELRVVGILEAHHGLTDRMILTALSEAHNFFQQALAAGKVRQPWQPSKPGNPLSHILVFFDPDQPRLKEAFFEIVNRDTAEQIIRVKEELQVLSGFVSLGHVATVAITVFMTLIAIVIATVLFTERFESTRHELALMRAVGYSEYSVAQTILTEAFLLASAGVAVGIFLHTLGGLLILKIFPIPWIGFFDFFNTWVFLLWAGALLTSPVSAVIPLLRLYRWNAHEALKGM